MTEDGDIEVQPAAGRNVFIRDEGGNAAKLPTLADYEALRSTFNSHTHVYSAGPAVGTVTTSPFSAPTTPITVDAPTGTQRLRVQ